MTRDEMISRWEELIPTVFRAEDGNLMAAMPFCNTHSIKSQQDIIEPIGE